MKYVIMCGGKYTKWQTPRQLLEYRGERIAERTIRLLQEAGVKKSDIYISATDPRFSDLDVKILKHRSVYTVDRGKVTEGLWCTAFYPMDTPACYLFGDVVYTAAAIRKIVDAETVSIDFFASAPPFAESYPKPYAEPFAFKVQSQKEFRAAIDAVAKNYETGIYYRHPIAWELWAQIIGIDPNEIDYGSYIHINDASCDVDDPGDLEAIRA